ncbi:MAG TPA: LPS export ABC transporter permease LptF [Micropepsaceae bacterium]|jgi:lipopolysaccharide export system permease protein|nr:LPS export ABC transporter permease LptF [Micropepsaceae bacterium]
MRKLFFYILRQIVGPFLLFTLLLTLVVWMTQSLRLLDLVINRGQSAAIFAYLTMLMLPSLLVIIAPIAFFGAALYALNKLSNDSELVVMWSAGVSRFQLALPVLTAAVLVMAIAYSCGLYLMPLGQRTMKDKVFDIRADIGAAILREGAFTTPSDGLTVFIRELTPSGEIRGILVHDNRETKRPITYLAESGVLAQTQEGARLIMQNGNIEQGEAGGARLSVLKFDRYVFDLDQYAGPQRASERDTSERYLPELLNPPFPADQPVRRGVYLAEAHNRLSAPLYCIAFALIALAATAKGRMARVSHALRLSGAALLGAALRLVGYGAQGLAARDPHLAVLLYLLPLSASLFAAAILGDVPLMPESIRRLFRTPVEEPA